MSGDITNPIIFVDETIDAMTASNVDFDGAASDSGTSSVTSGTLATTSQTPTDTTGTAGTADLAAQSINLTTGTTETTAVVGGAEAGPSATIAIASGSAANESATAAIPVPTPAAAAHYNDLVFDTEFTSLNSIDMSDSHASGFGWYLQNWFSTGATNPNDLKITNGGLELGGGTGEAAIVSAFANSSGGYTGTVFGNGAYMEASILYNPAGGSANESAWPAFWGLAIQHIAGAAQWPGQASGYANFAEVDVMEAYSSTAYTGTMHDWSGVYSSDGWEFNVANYGNNIIHLASVNWNVYHTYGLLWVPQSGNTPGSVTWYFDGTPESTIYWLGPATSTSMPGISNDSDTPSTPGQASETYSVLDSQQLALSLQTASNWPMYVDWVRVFQAGSAPAHVDTPTIASFSPFNHGFSSSLATSATSSSSLATNAAGDDVTNAQVLTLTGTADANDTVQVYDGTTWLGTATADANGAWSFTTPSLANGVQNFSAVALDAAGDTSASSATFLVTVQTAPPSAPVITSDVIVNTNAMMFTGTAEANSTITVFDGSTQLGTTEVNANGNWTFITAPLSNGDHTFTTTDTDAMGNTSAVSQPLDPIIGAPAPAAAPVISNNNVVVAEQQSVAASSLLTIANQNGDSITQYSFENVAGGNGHFTLGGTTQPNGEAFTVSASNLGSVAYVGGTAAGTDTLIVDAYDATLSAWVPAVTLNAVTTAPTTLVSSNDLTEALYIGYFGRAGDPAGEFYWLNQLSSGSMSLSALASSFSTASEATALYPLLASPSTATQSQITSFIGSIYQDLFDRAPDAPGLAYWDNYLTTNLTNPQAVGNFILTIINAAQGSDQTTVANKVTVADYFTQEFASAGIGYTPAAGTIANNALASVTSSSSSIFTAESALSAFLTAPSSAAEVALVGVSHSSVASSIN